MRKLITYIILASAFLCGADASAQDTRRSVENQIFLSPENDYLQDTVNKKGQVKDPDRIYKRLKGSKSGFVRNIANVILVSGDTRMNVKDDKEEMMLSEKYFSDFKGYVIDSINIIRKNIFTPDDSMSTNSKAEQLVDKAHIMTKDRVIRKYIMFKVGDKLDPNVMATNEYLLRELPFLASAFIVLSRSDQGGVIVNVFVREEWTIFAEWETGDFAYFGLYDQNFLGTGDRILISRLVNTDKQKGGFQVNYDFRNVMGKFIDAGIQLGVGGSSSAAAQIKRDYRIAGDWYWKAVAGYINRGEKLVCTDSSFFSKRAYADISIGKSFKISDDAMFMYASVSGAHKRYINSPPRTYVFNPAYHDVSGVYANVGIAKQHYFQGNMIYGYGKIEDIPYGFKAELTFGTGYSPQTSRYLYGGAQLRYSFYNNRFGYLNATAKGSIHHMITQRTWNMGMLDLRLNYFSPLFHIGKGYYLRNFIDFSVTQGFNRFIGERELLYYNSRNGVRGLYAPLWAYGTSRAVLNMESVCFTPIFLLHFRMAGFVWGDMAWLGDKSMFWDNTLSSAVGIGVRIKNERLIINNVEIRLGVALKCYPEKGYSWFSITNQANMRTENFNPTAAEEYEFK